MVSQRHRAFGPPSQALRLDKSTVWALVFLGLVVQTADAQIYKCLTAEGSMTYQDLPCPGDQVALEAPIISPVPPVDADAIQGLRPGEIALLEKIEEREQSARDRAREVVRERPAVDAVELTDIPDTVRRGRTSRRHVTHDYDADHHLAAEHERYHHASPEEEIESVPKPRNCAGKCPTP